MSNRRHSGAILQHRPSGEREFESLRAWLQVGISSRSFVVPSRQSCLFGSTSSFRPAVRWTLLDRFRLIWSHCNSHMGLGFWTDILLTCRCPTCYLAYGTKPVVYGVDACYVQTI